MNFNEFTKNDDFINKNDLLFSQSNLNTTVYAYLNSNIKKEFIMYDDKVNKYVVTKLYSLVNKFFKLSGENIDRHMLKRFEDKIYCFNGVVLPEYSRVRYEIHKIEKVNHKENQFKKYIHNLLKEMIALLMKDGFKTENELMYAKKVMVLLQILAGENITFFEAAFELFIGCCSRLNKLNEEDLIESKHSSKNYINNKLY